MNTIEKLLNSINQQAEMLDFQLKMKPLQDTVEAQKTLRQKQYEVETNGKQFYAPTYGRYVKALPVGDDQYLTFPPRHAATDLALSGTSTHNTVPARVGEVLELNNSAYLITKCDEYPGEGMLFTVKWCSYSLKMSEFSRNSFPAWCTKTNGQLTVHCQSIVAPDLQTEVFVNGKSYTITSAYESNRYSKIHRYDIVETPPKPAVKLQHYQAPRWDHTMNAGVWN